MDPYRILLFLSSFIFLLDGGLGFLFFRICGKKEEISRPVMFFVWLFALGHLFLFGLIFGLSFPGLYICAVCAF